MCIAVCILDLPGGQLFDILDVIEEPEGGGGGGGGGECCQMEVEMAEEADVLVGVGMFVCNLVATVATTCDKENNRKRDCIYTSASSYTIYLFNSSVLLCSHAVFVSVIPSSTLLSRVLLPGQSAQAGVSCSSPCPFFISVYYPSPPCNWCTS